ncbi:MULTISPECIES: TetR/AcrR family transcriptional regulator [Cedecea]|uniref:TetR/AcrR family transcriptional regulator n=1 Tax=Cedecea davisae TaxID=158484 RepID=A0ABS6DK65_9ENTR|nr:MULTISPECIES: TetR/AcrR family transcriptional regulator [Cedecea]MBU4683442.1 TetR/AcrR family transcriptional regulator [Cedecea davisae]MBU4685192.1 TetR/AcrR family transcriptional regulator [Cedecea davisae]QIX98129.1 TetR/AcrR family transcriptional regulator [Cedecea sp. FDAARGOS_727]
MNRHPEHDTREHLLAIGERLCLARGFTGMGLSELLRTAEVPKGSFYHYFRSKEAFGVAMLERYYQASNQRLAEHFANGEGNYRRRLLKWYQDMLSYFCQSGNLSNCLVVKLSAEVCDLSEDMRGALNNGGAQVIALLADALEKGRAEKSLSFEGEAFDQAMVLYALWLGASLQAKISRNAVPLESALAHVQTLLAEPVC